MQEITGDKKERTGGLEMLEDKDYVMRIVHEWIRTLIKLIFNKDIDKEEDAEIPLEVMEQFRKLNAMIDDGEINEAENILLDGLEEGNRAYFEMSLLFYEKLSGKTDDLLRERVERPRLVHLLHRVNDDITGNDLILPV